MLTALRPTKRIQGRIYWACRCECGAVTEARTSHLTSGRIVSCGCRKVKHGLAGTREFRIWYGMKRRCFDAKEKCYRDYGGRGITVCARWLVFANFIADMGPSPEGYSLERKDVNGNYEPANCVWMPLAQQQANKRPRKDVVLSRLSIPELEAEIAKKRAQLGVFG